MATLNFEYPAKIDGKIIKPGTPVDENSVAESVRAENAAEKNTAEESAHEDGGKQPDGDANADLNKMTMEELKSFAEVNGIDISGCKTKKDILAVLDKA